MKKIFTLFLIANFILSTPVLAATQFNVTGGGSGRKYDDHKYVEYGFSIRTHANFYSRGGGVDWGPWAMANFNGLLIIPTDIAGGIGMRSGNDVYFEAALGLRFSLIGGPGVAAILGLGFQVSGRMYIFFPVVLFTGGLGGIHYTPYIGWRL